MAVQITIRGCPRVSPDELAVQAALRCHSMQDYLRGELERISARPPVHVSLQEAPCRTATPTAEPPGRLDGCHSYPEHQITTIRHLNPHIAVHCSPFADGSARDSLTC